MPPGTADVPDNMYWVITVKLSMRVTLGATRYDVGECIHRTSSEGPSCTPSVQAVVSQTTPWGRGATVERTQHELLDLTSNRPSLR